MTKFKEIRPEEFNYNPFKLIGENWMLITAEKDGKANTMTASWGGLGVMWNKNVAYIVIRPQRYTKEFIDSADSFSLTFFNDSYKEILSYLGTKSGRDEDKIKKSNLTVVHNDNTPYFEEASIAIFCKKLFAQEYKPESFIDLEINKKCYPNSDYHTLYIGEVTKILVLKN
ncbi:NADH-FMN oxidoreductase RutF, flavin reductase (DIM6/NTAB) family [Tissierella praeacuta DSM 18095]|uniref:NADH-FMN oxidoreductase RutF, flavin reductase (DIM6/NTAB) family n=1 Tax=Tissierella praeacuta DSM 18095 TaxID=1123404 RepID=A0A1M4V452_9FIRM|nr:flavin reductase [Tissierella praeacuta]SHE63725.1 NADH-FMN oxidoreductase RutF, flavin reductase (DIM6/NTAB) family [Tissierella praeacuta DSM 18095]SUP02879.1 Flavoredoxin [Tissierella praeacuta]